MLRAIFTHSVLNNNGAFTLGEPTGPSCMKESKMAATQEVLWGLWSTGFKIQPENLLHFKEKEALGEREDRQGEIEEESERH